MLALAHRLYHSLTHPLITGALLLGGAVFGVLCASTPLSRFYHALLTSVPIPAVPLSYEHWISQGLMTLFFTTIALDMRHDMQPGGPLHHRHQRLLPLIGAAGGIIAPALIATLCSAFFPHSPGLKGWAIPTATDAAFTVPLLALIPTLPASLRAFLMALAIFDDLGAILILALFYGHTPNVTWLMLSGLPTLGLMLLGFYQKNAPILTLLLTCALWEGLFKAGIEPTLSGVVLGLCLPAASRQRLSQTLALPVHLIILPLFAAISTGIDLRHAHAAFFFSAPLVSAALGLWIGKPLGISGAVWVARRFQCAPPRTALQGPALLGVSMVCGIGFTMSLLITSLAYTNPTAIMEGRCGVLLGSILSAVLGWAVLRWQCSPSSRTNSECQK